MVKQYTNSNKLRMTETRKRMKPIQKLLIKIVELALFMDLFGNVIVNWYAMIAFISQM